MQNTPSQPSLRPHSSRPEASSTEKASRKKWKISVVSIIGTIAGLIAILQFAGVANIESLFYRPTPTIPTPVTADLVGEGIARYDFTFQRPDTWLRKDPQNSDGATFIDPTNSAVKEYVWGEYDVLGPLDSYVSSDIKDASSHPGYHIKMEQTPANVKVIEFASTKIIAYLDPAPGWRYAYEYQVDGKETTFVIQKAQRGNIIYSIVCQVPSDIYLAYQSVFLTVLSSLEIHVEALTPTGVPSSPIP